MYSGKMPRRPLANDDSHGPRPAKSAHSVGKAPSPDSPLSDNASDNSDLFHWATLDTPVAASIAPSFAAINASRKRKLLEQYFGNESRPGPLSTPPPPRTNGPQRFAFSSHRSHSDSCQHSSTESLCSNQESPLRNCNNVLSDNRTSDITWVPRVGGEDQSPQKPLSPPHPRDELMPAPKTHRSPTRPSAWQANILEDIDNNLAADFDGSLSGLGVDLSAASYNMSEALLALPSLTVFKQEIPSPSPSLQNDGRNGGQNSPDSSIRRTSDTTAGGGPPTSFTHLLQSQHFWHHQNQNLALEPHSLTTGVGTGSASSLASSSSNEGNHMVSHTVFGEQNCSTEPTSEYRLQYILGAATSVATKINEENLAYLNQGQSYEIKLRRFGQDLHRGKLLKSVVRLCFHDRRLQYMEKEQILAWRQANPGNRILEVDVPLSYGVSEVIQDQVNLNAATFTWNPAKEAGLYVKVHCISTEFTPKKHGGEKGVPFRIQLETYEADDPAAKRFHAAACQIKVFKLKGGDRKHKQDREKLMKRPPSEQEKYQPQSNFTVFTDIPLETLTILSSCSGEQSAAGSIPSYPRTASANELKPVFLLGDGCPSSENIYRRDDLADSGLLSADLCNLTAQPLQPEASAMQVTQWLQANRFGTYIATFNRFSGADLLRLTREDLVQILGVADGIRLFNILHSKPIIPRLTIFVCVSSNHVYSALYMSNVTCCELNSKLQHIVQMSGAELKDIFLQGPGGIHILVTDEVVRNLKDESTFNVEIIKESSEDGYSLLLKPSANF